MVTQEQLAELLAPVIWHGRYFITHCPWPENHRHGDTNPSFLVYPDGAVCLSASCQRRATLAQVYGQVVHQAPNEPITVGANRLVEWERIPDLHRLCDEAHTYLLSHPEQDVYLRQRGLAACIRPNQLGWWHGWITVPIFDPRNQFLGLVLRATPSMQQVSHVRYLSPPHQSRLLYQPSFPYQSLIPRDRLYVVFGIFDALALSLIGLPAITCTNITGFRSIDLYDFRCKLIVVPDRGEEDKGRELVSGLDWRGELKLIPYEKIADARLTRTLKDPADFIEFGLDTWLFKLLTH